MTSSKASKKKFLIIDAHALIHRAFHALPPLTTKEGQPINAVYGFLLILLRALKDIKPQYIAVTFDAKGKTFRHDQYDKYKATRPETPDELKSQFPIVHEVIEAFGFPSYTVPGYEADDLIATLCDALEQRDDLETIIVSGDLDLLQLVDSNTKMLKLHKGVKETILFDEATVKEKQGITPEQVTDYKGLRGDTSDNLPGVKGIGEKGAVKLLQKYGSIDNIFSHIEEITGRERKALEGHREDAELSKQLATLAHDAPIQFSLDDAYADHIDTDKVTDLLRKYEFKSLLTQLNTLPGFGGATTTTTTTTPSTQGAPHTNDVTTTAASTRVERDGKHHLTYHLVSTQKDIDALVEQLAQQPMFAFDTETTGLNSITAAIVGVSVAWNAGEGYYIPCANGVPAPLQRILENEKIHKTGHNVKFDIEVLHHAGVNVAGVVYDSMLASYLLNAGSRGHGLDNLAFIEFGHQMQPIEALIGKGKKQISMAQVPVEQVAWYAAEDADFSWRLYTKYEPLLRREKLDHLMHDIEIPTLLTLVTMEEAGVKIDTDFLVTMSKKLHQRIDALEKKIHSVAGVTFNISSSIQLKEVLFKVLNISTDKIKKTKTGFSTAASELEKMQDLHPIIGMITEYRELTKLTSTYIDTLPNLINPETGRIHTSYNQTIAATGRLSSTDPNLQNIPVRTELGREIRKAFIPDRGRRILSADYSQIELRIVAHLADDPVMKQAFKDGEDIHSRTAAELNDVPLGQVTKEMRRQAKAINFGILYGMGVQGIMRDSGVRREEAQAFLEKYFSIHKGIAKYIADTKQLAHEQGYVTTLFGRRRPLPEINASNRMLQAAAERAAINMPTQGTAADIMKLAMVAVQKEIDAGRINALMTMQVHDELVFEIAAADIAAESKKIQHVMENTYKLSVPLDVNLSVGTNWGELESL